MHKHRLEQIQLSHRHVAKTEIALLQHKPGRSVAGEHAQGVLVNDDVDEGLFVELKQIIDKNPLTYKSLIDKELSKNR